MNESTKQGLVFGGLLAMGLLVLTMGIMTLNQAEQTKSWNTTSGTILDSYVSMSWVSDHSSYSSSGHYEYAPNVVYRYQVGSQEYVGNRISISGGSSSDSAQAYSVISKYPVGSQVTVNYDPSNPASSVLQTGSTNEWIIIVVASVFTAIGAGGLLWMLVSNRRKKVAM